MFNVSEHTTFFSNAPSSCFRGFLEDVQRRIDVILATSGKMNGADVTGSSEMVPIGESPVANVVGNLVGNSSLNAVLPPPSAPMPLPAQNVLFPPRNPVQTSTRRGLSTFSIDSLLFDVMQKANAQFPPPAQNVFPNFFPRNQEDTVQTPSPAVAETGEPFKTDVSKIEKTSVNPTKTPQKLADSQETETKMFEKSGNITPETVSMNSSSRNVLPFNSEIKQKTPETEKPENPAPQESSVTSDESNVKPINDSSSSQSEPLCPQSPNKVLKEPKVEQGQTLTPTTRPSSEQSPQMASKPEMTQTTPETQKNLEIRERTSMPMTPASARVSDDALFKTPSPIDRRGRKPKTRYFVKKDLPPAPSAPPAPLPPPAQSEEVVSPKEEPIPKVEVKNPLDEHSVDLIFLALIGEDPVEARTSEKSLTDLVLAKKRELESETSSLLKSSKIEEDCIPTDQKKLEEVIKDETPTFTHSPSPATPECSKRLLATVAKRGRKRTNSKLMSTGSDTDTDTFSTGDIEEDDYQDMIKQQDEEMTDIANTLTPSGLLVHNSRKRPSQQPPPIQEIAPKTRRSARIKDRVDFFYKSAVAALLEPDEEDEDIEDLSDTQGVSSGSKPRINTKKESPNTRSSVSKNYERLVEEPSPHQAEAPKKTRAAVRAEYYQKRNEDDKVIAKIMSHVMTPMPSRDCQILDHFCYPVVRRAIVNKNTLCYAISMLQLMLRVPQIYSIVKCHSHDTEVTRGCFLCLMGNIISSRPSFDEYSTFVALMKTTWKGVEVDMMHCVMEAMQKFFNRFDEDYLKGFPEYAAKMPTEFSPVRSIFEIQLMNEYCCCDCDYVSHGMDKAIYLSIDLTKKSDGTMQSLVDNIHNPTAVFGMECPVCDGTEFYCSTFFHKLPEVLLYFVPRVRTKRREKDMTVVQVQKELVLRDKEKEHNYALCSFLTHCGATGNKGHYKQYEVDRTNGVKFNEFDDARVILDSKLSRDITVVLAMFRKEEAVAKDEPIDVIFDGRGNVLYSHPRHGR